MINTLGICPFFTIFDYDQDHIRNIFTGDTNSDYHDPLFISDTLLKYNVIDIF